MRARIPYEMIHETLKTYAVLIMQVARSSTVKQFLSEKIVFVACLACVTGFLFHSCVMSPIPVLQDVSLGCVGWLGN